MFTQHPLGELDEKIHPPGGLQNAGGGDRGDDDVDHRGGRRAWLHPEDKHQDGQADTGDHTQGDTTPSCAEIQAGQNNQELEYREHARISMKNQKRCCCYCYCLSHVDYSGTVPDFPDAMGELAELSNGADG